MRSPFRRGFAVVVLVAVAVIAGERRSATQAAQAPQIIAPASDVAMRAWNDVVSDRLRAGTLREARVDADTQTPGRTHQRLDQYFSGVRVFGGDVVRQLSAGQVVSVFGTLYDGIALDVQPTLAPGDAHDRIVALSGADPRAVETPELVALPLAAGGFALTYRAQASSAAGLTMYFVDARTGGVTWQYNNLQSQSAVRNGIGVLADKKKVSMRRSDVHFKADDLLRPTRVLTYDMQGNLARTKSVLAGVSVVSDVDLANDTDDPWLDSAAVDAHTYAGWTYDYYFTRFGRHGLDDHDLPIASLVHPADRATAMTATTADLTTYYLNAFWNGSVRMMTYGDGLPPGYVVGGTGQYWTYLSGGLDVAAHELTHGVTQFSSALIYLNESGALNEAFSDIMGTSVEFYYQAVRGHANYLIGEDVVTPGGLRSMADPGAHGDPDHYSRRYLGTDDNGGVHTNSGIANQAFYLAIEGGTNRTSGLAVTGVGATNRDQVERVFYRAFTSLMPSNATFAVARQATIQAARDLYGSNSPAEKAVTQAWTAVGVN